MKGDKYGNYSSCFCLYRDTVSWCTCALRTSQGTRVKQKVSSTSQISKQTLRSWSRLQAKIVIIDPKSYQGTHFFVCHLRIQRWTSPEKAKHRRIFSNLKNQQRWEMTRSLIQGRDSLIFPNICNLPPSSFQLFITMIFSAMLLIHFSCYFGTKTISPVRSLHLLFSCSFAYCV